MTRFGKITLAIAVVLFGSGVGYGVSRGYAATDSALLVALLVAAGGLVVGVLEFLARSSLHLLRADRAACSRGWHLWRQFHLGTKQRFAGRTEYYLAWNGVTIRRCRGCASLTPPGAEPVYEAYAAGLLVPEQAGRWSDLKLRIRR